MVEREVLSIDREKVDDYRALIENKFREWYKSKWFFIGYAEFINLSSTSFLAYLKYFLEKVSVDGVIDVNEVEDYSREITGEYFSDEKFSTARRFLAESQWEFL